MPLSDVTDRIRAAETRAGRPAGAVELIAVSKVQPLDRVEAVLDEGWRVFGENRVQEAQGKWPAFAERYDGLKLHLIGPLQTNKVRQALDLFHAIHAVDRPKLATKLADEIQARGAAPELYVQINTGEEPQKAGALPTDADAFITQCREDLDLPLTGLMCIPPATEDPAPHFALLAKIAARNGLTGLSMGMSGDYESAISLGATAVRVGSAIFGARSYG